MKLFFPKQSSFKPALGKSKFAKSMLTMDEMFQGKKMNTKVGSLANLIQSSDSESVENIFDEEARFDDFDDEGDAEEEG